MIYWYSHSTPIISTSLSTGNAKVYSRFHIHNQRDYVNFRSTSRYNDTFTVSTKRTIGTDNHHITRFEKCEIRINNRQKCEFKKFVKAFCPVNSAYINSPGLIYCQLIWIIALFVLRSVVLDCNENIGLIWNAVLYQTYVRLAITSCWFILKDPLYHKIREM